MEWERHKGCTEGEVALLLLLAVAGLCDLVSPFHCSCQARAALRTWSAFLASTKQLARLCVFTKRSMLPHYSLRAFQPSAMPPSVCLQLAQLTNLVVPSFSPSSYPSPPPFLFLPESLSSTPFSAGLSRSQRCSLFSILQAPAPKSSCQSLHPSSTTWYKPHFLFCTVSVVLMCCVCVV